MRVIAGEFRSRRLKTLPGLDVRPTPDRLREALFNVLAPRLPGCVFIDAYAGCGAVGIEAISRGAARVIFIEKKRAGVMTIRDNLHALGVAKGFDVYCGKAAQILRRISADIVFLDPPYPETREYDASLEALGENAPGLAIAQHASRQALKERYGGLRRTRVLRQGDNSLSFFEPAG
jgi:16S rRNA (guanine966-N2)-methyltransferase